MLKTIKLKNFRTHKVSKLTFCSGVNGIIGISSSGKTNILRAIKLVYANRPVGDGVISRFAKDKTATIETDWSGIGTIKMVKSKNSKENFYQINDEQRFRKYGAKIPAPITEAINLSEINLANQFDGPYLIFSGPGEISKTINEITGADDFDTWIYITNQRIKKVKFNLKDADFRIEKYTIVKEKLEGITRLKRRVAKTVQVSNELAEKKKEFDYITELYNQLLGVRAKLQRHKDIVSLGRKVNRIKKIQKRLSKLDTKFDLLNDFVNHQKAYKIALQRHEEIAKKFIKRLRKERQCPTCFSPIKQSTIKRLKDAVSIIK